jgi:hypothetical protein
MGPYRLSLKLKALLRLLWQTIKLVFTLVIQTGRAMGRVSDRILSSATTPSSTKTTRKAIAKMRQLPKLASTESLVPVGQQVIITAENGEYEFHFNSDGLDAIIGLRERNEIPDLPNGLLSSIRQASLFQVIPRPYRRKKRAIAYVQSGISFCTVFTDASLGETTAEDRRSRRVVRTVLSLDGDMVQQISEACLHHPRGLDLIAAHHWLSHQLLQQLRLSISNYIDKVVLGGGLSVFVVTTLTNAATIMSEPMIALPRIALSLISSIAITLIWELVRENALPRLNRWVLRWLWGQLMSPTSLLRSLAGWVMGLR